MGIPGFRALTSPRPLGTDVGLLALRLVFGFTMAIWHGWAKLPVDQSFIDVVAKIGIPLPDVLAWFAVLCEFVGGALLLVGFLTRPAALAVLGTMLVAIFVRYAGRPLDERELAILYAAAAAALFFTGPGRFSIDAALTKSRR